MPRVETRKARTDIYDRGIKHPDPKTKSGFRRDKSQPHPDGDTRLVEKGQTYYTWSFRFGPTMISLTYPKRSQLTRSGFLRQLYDLEDRISETSGDSPEALESERDEIVSELESLRDECQESFDNMPEGLQEGSESGQLLQERIDGLENAISEFEGLDFDYDEPDEKELTDELTKEDPALTGAELLARLQERRDEHLDEWLREKEEEIQGISIEAS